MSALPHLLAIASSIALTAGITMIPLVAGHAATPAQERPVPDGAELYGTTCASCHAPDGRGTPDGPSLLDEGPAAVDWVLRTGRMPLSSPGVQAVARSEPRFDSAQIDAIISHLQSLGMEGPGIPTVDLSGADVVRGGEIFRRNCASCHQSVAQGGAVNGGRDAPDLQGVDALTIAEVLKVGPGVMPNFSELDDTEVADVSAWVIQVGQEPDDRGGAGIGHIGPIAEGLALLLVIAIGVLGLARWIGDRTTDMVASEPIEVAPAGGSHAGAVSVEEPRSWAARLGSRLVALAAVVAVVMDWVKTRRSR